MRNIQKKLQFLSLILMVGLLFSSVTIPIRAFIQKQGTVNEAVTLRQNADAGSNQIMELTKGQPVTVNNELTVADGTTWYQLFIDNTTGYVPANTITISDGSSTGAQTGTPGTGQTMQTITITERVGTVTATGAIRVRAQATTSSEQIASMNPNDTFKVLSDVNAGDGYVWYEVDFDDHGTMVRGFVRSDLVKVEEVTMQQQIPVDDPVTEPTPSVPDAPYSITSQVNAEGTTVWYLFNNSTGEAKEISTLLTPQQADKGNVGVYKIIVVILLILVILTAAAATFFYMRWQDAETFIDELREKQVRARKQPTQAAARTVPVKQSGPVVSPATGKQTTVQPAMQGLGDISTRPASQSTSQPVSTPVTKPTSQPVSTPVTKPTSQPVSTPVTKPTSQPVSTPVSKPVTQSAGQTVTKPTTQEILPKTSDIVRTTKQELSANQTGAATAPKSGSWKSKNFLTDDDDLEFDFLDMDDK